MATIQENSTKESAKQSQELLTEREQAALTLLEAQQERLDCEEEHKAVFTRHDKAKKAEALAEKTLLDLLATEKLRADKEAVISLPTGTVTVGKKGNKTEVTDPDLVKKELNKVEKGLFDKLANVTLTDIKKYLTPNVLAKVTKVTAANKRKVKVELN